MHLVNCVHARVVASGRYRGQLLGQLPGVVPQLLRAHGEFLDIPAASDYTTNI